MILIAELLTLLGFALIACALITERGKAKASTGGKIIMLSGLSLALWGLIAGLLLHVIQP